jgi:hypothetical protein
MALAIAIILGILALVFVLYPLYQRPAGGAMPSTSSRSAEALYEAEGTAKEALEREQTARAAIQEVELDYQLGNIEEEDYRSLRDRYMHRALSALKSRYEREQNIDDEIEEQLQKLKESYEKVDYE